LRKDLPVKDDEEEEKDVDLYPPDSMDMDKNDKFIEEIVNHYPKTLIFYFMILAF
jgi:hypothetical protein